MILPGKLAIARKLLTNLQCATTQIQPCGIDLSLKTVLRFDTDGRIDFDNSRRETAATCRMPFVEGQGFSLHLKPGSYLVEFNELVDMPRNAMGQLFPRSTLWRSGAMIQAGVIDSGYKGMVGGLLTVSNVYGLRVCEGARLAQIIFHQMNGDTDAYSGKYQGLKAFS